MDAASILLTLFHGICFISLGILAGYNYVTHVKRELKITSKNYYIKYLIVLILVGLIMWAMVATAILPEQEEKHWTHYLFNSLLVGLGMLFTTRILLYKHWDEYKNSKLKF